MPVNEEPSQLSLSPLGNHDDLHCIVLSEGDVLQSHFSVPAAVTFRHTVVLCLSFCFDRLMRGRHFIETTLENLSPHLVVFLPSND